MKKNELEKYADLIIAAEEQFDYETIDEITNTILD